MKVFVFSPGADTGGQGYRIARAFAKHAPAWDVRAMAVSSTFIGYAEDVPYSKVEAQRLYDAADVVHHKNSLHGYATFEHGDRQPTVIHHQGTRLRENAEAVSREVASVGAVSLTSTVDLGLSVRGPSTWLPSPFDLDAIARYRRRRSDGRIRIAHAPTNRTVKGTETIITALERLAFARFPIEFDLIERQSWAACLARKGLADLFIDQLKLGYGNNAIEAWAMGIPVVAGVADPAVRALMIREWGELPFFETTPATLAADLAGLLRSPQLREEYAERGRRHVERYHSEAAVVALLQRVYRAVPPSLGAAHLEIANVRYDYPPTPKNRSRVRM